MRDVLTIKDGALDRGASVALAIALAGVGLCLGSTASAEVNPMAHPSAHGSGIASSAAPGHAQQGYLGVDLREVPEDTASTKFKAARDPRGAEIVHVDHDGPAGKAGLRERDVIQTMNGQGIDGVDQLRRLLRELPPGRSLTMTIVREGQPQTISAQMGNREDVDREAWQQHVELSDPQPVVAAPADAHKGNGFFSPGHAGRGFIGGTSISPGYTGVILEKMAPQLAAFFGAQVKLGLLVSRVDENSPAAVAGLRAGGCGDPGKRAEYYEQQRLVEDDPGEQGQNGKRGGAARTA